MSGLLGVVAFGCHQAIQSGREPRYDVFLSHHKGGAGNTVRYMKFLLQRIHLRVFFDADDLGNLDTLFDAVKSSRQVLLCLSAETATRPYCVGEMVVAHQNSIPMLPVVVTSDGSEHAATVSSHLGLQMKGQYLMGAPSSQLPGGRQSHLAQRSIDEIRRPPDWEDRDGTLRREQHTRMHAFKPDDTTCVESFLTEELLRSLAPHGLSPPAIRAALLHVRSLPKIYPVSAEDAVLKLQQLHSDSPAVATQPTVTQRLLLSRRRLRGSLHELRHGSDAGQRVHAALSPSKHIILGDFCDEETVSMCSYLRHLLEEKMQEPVLLAT